MRSNNGGSQGRCRRALMESRNRVIDECHWCKHPIVWVRLLNPEDLITKEALTQSPPPHQIRFRYDGKVYCLYPATVDHVVPRALGGSNDLSNLVPACRNCNTRRNHTKQLEPVYDICRRCKRPMGPSTKQTCGPCKDAARRAWADTNQLRGSGHDGR